MWIKYLNINKRANNVDYQLWDIYMQIKLRKILIYFQINIITEIGTN